MERDYLDVEEVHNAPRQKHEDLCISHQPNRYQLIVTVFLCLTTVFCFAQQTIEAGNDSIFTIIERPAQFSGGLREFDKYVKTNLQYPKIAKRKGIEGKVFVEFTVNLDGSVSDIKVVKGISKECDAEAIRLIQKSTNWRPAEREGENLRPKKIKMQSKLVCPIEFKLTDKK